MTKGLRLQSTEKSDEKSFLAFLKKHVQKKPLIRLMAGDTASDLNQIFSNLENWLKETHHGVSQKYLQKYLDEYVYLFDRSKNQAKKFQTLMSLLLKPSKNSS